MQTGGNVAISRGAMHDARSVTLNTYVSDIQLHIRKATLALIGFVRNVLYIDCNICS